MIKSEKNVLYQYNKEVEVEYQGEKYLVRDNGSVYRKSMPGSRKRPLDEIWTFGKQNKQTGYMNLGAHVVHRIVAFAFHGNPPSDKHVVDHSDTNHCNNRSDNLRWVTRLENLILNPITLKRIITAWGSLDNFFENPNAKLNSKQNVDWMRPASKEEADSCLSQFLKWAESDALPRGGELGEWVYNKLQPRAQTPEPIKDIQSLSPLAIQRSWKTPTEFPCCPNNLGPDPLEDYINNLHSGAILARDKYKESLVVLAEKGDALISVLAESQEENPVKPWTVAKVRIENGKFVHESIGSFFDLNGAKKAHYKLLNIPFKGKSIDDYL